VKPANVIAVKTSKGEGKDNEPKTENAKKTWRNQKNLVQTNPEKLCVEEKKKYRKSDMYILM